MGKLRKALDYGLAYAVLSIFALLSTAALMVCTKYGTETKERFADRKSDCLGPYTDFGMHFLYVIQLCTTVGFGNLDSCNLPGKISTVAISMLGLPLIVYVVMDAGERMERYSRFFYRKYHSRRNKLKLGDTYDNEKKNKKNNGATIVRNASNSTTHSSGRRRPKFSESMLPLTPRATEGFATSGIPMRAVSVRSVASPKPDRSLQGNNNFFPNTDEMTNADDDDDDYYMYDLPIWFSIAIFATCILICSLYYHFIESFYLGNAVYRATLIFFSGDFYVQQHSKAIPMYIVIFIGFSMLSMAVNTVMGNIKNLIEKVKVEVEKEIEQAALNADGELDVPEMENLIDGIMKKYSSFVGLKRLIPEKTFRDLQDFCSQTAVHKHEQLVQEAKASVSIMEKAPLRIDKTCAITPEFRNAATGTILDHRDRASQASRNPRHETKSQTEKELFSQEKSVHTKPDSRDHSDQFSSSPSTKSLGCSAKPESQSTSMQYDRASELRNLIINREDVKARRGIWELPFYNRDSSPSSFSGN